MAKERLEYVLSKPSRDWLPTVRDRQGRLVGCSPELDSNRCSASVLGRVLQQVCYGSAQEFILRLDDCFVGKAAFADHNGVHPFERGDFLTNDVRQVDVIETFRIEPSFRASEPQQGVDQRA